MLEAAARYVVTTLPTQRDDILVRAIYAIQNTITGNLYIGSSEHVSRRFRAHISELRRGIHHSLRLQWAWRTKGEAAFEFLIVEVVDPHADLIKREQELIALMRPQYNTAECADNPMKGKRHTPEAIEKMRQNRRGKGLGPRVFTPEHRAALSAAAPRAYPGRRGVKLSVDVRQKMSSAARAKYAAGYINGRTRPVELNGMQYPSGVAAALALGVSKSQIVALIKRERGRYLI